jgi:hypothetical protein
MDYSFRVISCSVLLKHHSCQVFQIVVNWHFFAGLKFHTERFHNLEPSGAKKAKQAVHVDTTNPLPTPAPSTTNPLPAPAPTPNNTTAKPQRPARTRKGREKVDQPNRYLDILTLLGIIGFGHFRKKKNYCQPSFVSHHLSVIVE